MYSNKENLLSDNELLAVFDNAAIVLILIDKDGRVVRINKLGTKLLGDGNNPLTGRLAGDVLKCVNVHKKNNNAGCGNEEKCTLCDIRNTFTSVFLNGDDINQQEGSITVMQNGSFVTLQLLISANKVNVEHKSYVLLTIDDITRLKQQEEELKSLIKTRDKLYSVIAHDLRSPLGVIKGFSDFLIASYDSIDKEQIQSFLGHIQQSSHDTISLLDNLFEWTSTQWNHTQFNPNEINVGKLCHEVLDMCKSLSNGKEVSLIYPDNSDVSWNLDENMIKTVLRNIVNNAIKFTYRGGQVAIRTEINDRSLFFIVEDTGIGIQKEKLQTIFSDESCDASDGTESEKGTGLGLLICKEFVEKHNGEISVESEVGIGSRFTFSIPFGNVEK